MDAFTNIAVHSTHKTWDTTSRVLKAMVGKLAASGPFNWKRKLRLFRRIAASPLLSKRLEQMKAGARDTADRPQDGRLHAADFGDGAASCGHA